MREYHEFILDIDTEEYLDIPTDDFSGKDSARSEKRKSDIRVAKSRKRKVVGLSHTSPVNIFIDGIPGKLKKQGKPLNKAFELRERAIVSEQLNDIA